MDNPGILELLCMAEAAAAAGGEVRPRPGRRYARRFCAAAK